LVCAWSKLANIGSVRRVDVTEQFWHNADNADDDGMDDEDGAELAA
jgi:hypothetical protein